MDIQNARTTTWSRAEIIRQVREFGQSDRAVARAFHVTPKTARTWVRRADGELTDRSSRPQHVPSATPPELVSEIERLRRQRWTAVEIAANLRLGRSRSRASSNGWARRAWPPSSRRRPSCATSASAQATLCISTSRSSAASDAWAIASRATGAAACGASAGSTCTWRSMMPRGWRTSRCCPTNRGRRSRPLRRALAWFRRHGIRVRGVMTDNAFAYLGRAFAGLCQLRGLRHARIRPYTPRTSGEAERFIRTMLAQWAYGWPYASSRARVAALRWLHYCNWHRPHMSLDGRPPITRVVTGGTS